METPTTGVGLTAAAILLNTVVPHSMIPFARSDRMFLVTYDYCLAVAHMLLVHDLLSLSYGNHEEITK